MPLGVVPVPVRLEAHDGPPFVLRAGVRVLAAEPVLDIAVLAAAQLGRAGGTPLTAQQPHDAAPGHAGSDAAGRPHADGRPHTDSTAPGVIELALADASELGLATGLAAELVAEAHRIEVTARGVVVRAVTAAGLGRAVATLVQLVRADGPTGVLDPCLVVDHPRFAWRGLALDVSRHFFAVPEVIAVIDVMADYKLNVLHLHLTDDQGWRLEVAGRPELTERSGATSVGGERGGFYTAADYAALVAHAATRHVVVVPEIDVPGHVNAALHADGRLTPSGEPPGAYTGIEVGFSRLHAGLPATETFLRDVFGAVAAMTPGRHVHLGGDEVLTMVPEEYAALVRSAAGHIEAAGKTVVGWQEVAGVLPLPGPRAREVVIQYWDEREGAAEVAAAVGRGARVLLSPASRVYLDMKYDADSPIGLEWAGHVEVRDAYDWEPLDVLDVPADRVAGVEAGLWTETVVTAEDLFWLLLPRLVAVAEVAWSPAARRDWDGFAARLAGQSRRWDAAGLTWHRSPQVPWP